MSGRRTGLPSLGRAECRLRALHLAIALAVGAGLSIGARAEAAPARLARASVEAVAGTLAGAGQRVAAVATPRKVGQHLDAAPGSARLAAATPGDGPSPTAPPAPRRGRVPHRPSLRRMRRGPQRRSGFDPSAHRGRPASSGNARALGPGRQRRASRSPAHGRRGVRRAEARPAGAEATRPPRSRGQLRFPHRATPAGAVIAGAYRGGPRPPHWRLT